MELIDTSAWIEYLRATGSPAHLEVRRLLHESPASVVTTEPVVMELLVGAADDRVAKQLERLTDGLRLLPIDAALDYRDAALTYRAARGTMRRPRYLPGHRRGRGDAARRRRPAPAPQILRAALLLPN